MDAIHFNIKSNGKVSNRGTYVVLGINLEGKKDILTIFPETKIQRGERVLC